MVVQYHQAKKKPKKKTLISFLQVDYDRPFEVVIATESEVSVVDTRYPKQPSIRWKRSGCELPFASAIQPVVGGDGTGTATSTSGSDRLSRVFQFCTAPHAPCAVLYLAPLLIGCRFGACNPMMGPVQPL